jgi:type IV secretion system protein VirD4
MIVIRPGMFPIRARRIRYYDEKPFSRLIFPPPEVPAIDIPVRMDQGTVPLPTPAEGAAPDAPTPNPEAQARPKASRTKKAKPAAEAAAPASPPPAPAPAMRPFQSEGLMTSVMGTAVDLTEFGLPDGKAKVATIVDATPTVASRNRSSGIAAE